MKTILGYRGCFKSKREFHLHLALSYGMHGDRDSFTRLYIESRAGRAALLEQYRKGAASTSAKFQVEGTK